jgi:DNA-binding transcriptional LysR family regulator
VLPHKTGGSAGIAPSLRLAAVQNLSLRYLHEAAKLGSMRAAGDKLGVAVSSVSRAIAQLEAEAGIALIEHGRRSVKLTEAGALMIDYYGEHLAHLEALELRLSDLKGVRAGQVRLAVGEGFVGAALSGVLSRFVQRHKGVQVDVQMAASSNEVALMVAEDEADLGLAFQSSDDPRIRVRAAIRQPLCVVMLPQHPLARQQDIQLADLGRHDLCLLQPSFRTRQLLKVAEAAERVTLQPAITANSLVLLKDLIKAGNFATLLPLLAVSKEVSLGELVATPFSSPVLQDTAVQLVSRLGRRLTPAANQLLNMLVAYLDTCGQLLDAASKVAAMNERAASGLAAVADTGKDW